MTAEPTDLTLKSTWKWRDLAYVVCLWAALLGMLLSAGALGSDFVGFTVILIAGEAYIVVVQLRFRVMLTGEGITVRAWRRRFIPRRTIAAVGVRRSFGGRRLTVICTDGTNVRLPVPWPRDPRWNEMLREAQQWVANFRCDGTPQRSG